MITNTSENKNPEWLFGGNSNAIENQEKEGQKELINSSQLPRNTNMSKMSIEKFCEKIGIKIDGDGGNDNLFINVILPDGWKIKATDHSMWNKLIDNEDRERASIFYKAAFYDRSALINFVRKYNVGLNEKYINGVDGDSDLYERVNNTELSYNVSDGNKILFETDTTIFDIVYNENEHRKWWDEWNNFKDDKINECRNWLGENYPEWREVWTYWD